MSTAAEKKAAEEAAGQTDPVHADATQIGVALDDPRASDDTPPKGVRVDERDGRTLYPWEVDPKDQAGPAGVENRKRAKKD